MRETFIKKVKLFEEELPIDPRPTQRLINETNDIEVKFEKEIMLYDDIDTN
jgi:hypothetical protein